MSPATLDLETFVQGDTWPGLGAFRLWALNESTQEKESPAVACASAKINIARTLNQGTPDLVLATGTDAMTLDSAAEWRFTVPAQALALEAGRYLQAFVTTDANGVVTTYWSGSLTILQRVPGT